MENHWVRLFTNPLHAGVADSGWHGTHNWRPQCSRWELQNFHYQGDASQAERRHSIEFIYDVHAAGLGVTRYIGFEIEPVLGNMVEVTFFGISHHLVTPGVPGQLALSHVGSRYVRCTPSGRLEVLPIREPPGTASSSTTMTLQPSTSSVTFNPPLDSTWLMINIPANGEAQPGNGDALAMENGSYRV